MADRTNLAHPFWALRAGQGDRTALVVGQESVSYARLAALASGLGAEFAGRRGSGRIGILASRSLAACAGILGTCWSGGTYVPLHLKLPEERLLLLLQQLELDALVADARGAGLLTPAVLARAPRCLVLADDAGTPEAPPATTVLRLGQLAPGSRCEPAEVGAEHVAYIEFTSGTTGTPKGVMVPVGAVNHYLRVMQEAFGLTPEDRAAETCDITFDLSVHNMFLTWGAGAALHVMTPLQMVAPARFIRHERITTWLSVPSIIAMLRQSRTLAAGLFPSLRLSTFCGEPLPVVAARAWAEAAPNSVVENLYGPTEATVACLRQRLEEPPRVTPRREIVAIGRPYPGMRAAILDRERRPVARGVPGELALAGAQLALGYYRAPELTAERFPLLDGTRWYLTGDLAQEDEDGVFHHLGRLDNQVKVLGHRVELEEVETYLRAATGADLVAAVAWPSRDGAASGLVGFVAGVGLDAQAIREELMRRLPGYMVPAALHVLDALPLSANGKVDRRALLTRLDEACA